MPHTPLPQALLDRLRPFEPLDLPRDTQADAFIGAVGFEDCAFAFLDGLADAGGSLATAVTIRYKPFNERNRKGQAEARVAELLGLGGNHVSVVYDRYDPNSFKADDVLDAVAGAGRVWIDISGMSKFLIVNLLHALRGLRADVTVVYSEAEVYHPTREAFEAKREGVGPLPVFLTTDVHDVVTTRALTSVAMQGQPTVLAFFPTFNHRELTALVSEVMPQRLVVIEGVPRRPEDEWRADALRWIGGRVLEFSSPPSEREHGQLSMFDYPETVRYLQGVYDAYGNTHRIVVAPTGSKPQALAVLFFKQLHPDVQLVYPVTKSFLHEYTEGVRTTWGASLPDFAGLMDELDRFRWRDVLDIPEVALGA